MAKPKIILDEMIKYVPSAKIPISSIFFDENNPNKMTDAQVQGLEQFMERIGYAVEIWVNKEGSKYRIIDGEWRVRVLQKRGIKFVWAKIFEVKYSEIRLMRQLANKIGGTHDKHKDLEEFKAIFEDQNLDDFTKMLGVPIEDIQRELEKEFDITFGPEETEDIPELPLNPKSKSGEIYQLGNHLVLCGDCTSKDSFIRLFNGKKPQLTFTDPPYNIGFNYNQHDDKMQDDEYLKFCNDWFSNLDCDKIVITPGPRNLKFWYKIKEPNDIGIWHKANSTSGATVFFVRTCEPILFYGKFKKRGTDFFDYTRVLESELTNSQRDNGVGDNYAPAKPVKFVLDILKSFSSQQDLICDVFLGNGTTLIACEQSKRTCYGIEKDPRYVDVIIQRWETLTGLKAKRITKY